MRTLVRERTLDCSPIVNYIQEHTLFRGMLVRVAVCHKKVLEIVQSSISDAGIAYVSCRIGMDNLLRG
jgi:hypothetical protein